MWSGALLKLHVGAGLSLLRGDLDAGLDGARGVANLLKALDEFLLVGLGRVVFHLDELAVEYGLDLLHAFLKAEVLLDLVFAAGAVHLGLCSEDDGLEILGEAAAAEQGHEGEECDGFFHDVENFDMDNNNDVNLLKMNRIGFRTSQS